MTFTHAFLMRLYDHGLDLDETIKLGFFIEAHPSAREMVDAILDGIDRNPTLAADYFKGVVAALPNEEPPKRKQAANDRTPRMSATQRRARYDHLVARDGPQCCDCGCEESTIWRRQGVWNNDFGRYTKVHPTTNLEVDHKTPLWAGGTNEISNLWLLCVECHKRKTAEEAGQRRRA